MKKEAGNDVIEIVRVLVPNNAGGFNPHLMHHDRIVLDKRAQMTMSLITTWGAAQFVGDAMRVLADKPEDKDRTVGVLVSLASETVDAYWLEMERRGWLVKLQPLVEE